MIPHPLAKLVGGIMQLTDVIYDTKDAFTNPTKTNIGHLALDGLSFVPGLTNTVLDDILKVPDAIDDTYTAVTGRDAIEDTKRLVTDGNKKKTTTNTKKRTNRK